MRKLRRDIQVLKVYAFGSTLALLVLSTAAFRQATPRRQAFDEIDAERINIIEKDSPLLIGPRRQLPLLNGSTWRRVTANGPASASSSSNKE